MLSWLVGWFLVHPLWVLVNSDRRKFGSCMFSPEKMGIIRTWTASHDNSDCEIFVMFKTIQSPICYSFLLLSKNKHKSNSDKVIFT